MAISLWYCDPGDDFIDTAIGGFTLGLGLET
jgi:hypothetical protein